MKKGIAAIMIVAMLFAFSSCRQADMVSHNLSKEADNFNVVRQLTVINCIKGDVLFQMTGKLSIQEGGKELQVIVELEDGTYKKHFIGISDNVTYIVEDITGKNVDNYKYTLNFNPNMWIPVEVETIN